MTYYADGYVDGYADDYATAAGMHHSLMFVSGGYRQQCVLMAGTPGEYRTMRFEQGPTGLNVRQVVAAHLGGLLPLQGMPSREELRRFADACQDVNEAILTHTNVARREPIELGVRLPDTSEPVQALLQVQYLGLRLAVGHAVMAARVRGGDFSRVPLLEPKSITDASLYYPFAR